MWAVDVSLQICLLWDGVSGHPINDFLEGASEAPLLTPTESLLVGLSIQDQVGTIFVKLQSKSSQTRS